MMILPNYDQILPDDGLRDTMVSSLRLKFSTHNELVREISSFSLGCFRDWTTSYDIPVRLRFRRRFP
jgi:hypothetical protein